MIKSASPLATAFWSCKRNKLKLILTFENIEEWLIFFNFSSPFLLKCPLRTLFTRIVLIFPGETVVLDNLNKNNISEINQYTKNFFEDKNRPLFKRHNLLLKESKFIKTLSGQIMWLKPTFLFPRESIFSLIHEKPIRKILLVYPQKFSLKAEIRTLLADKDKVPFYYYLNNEFNQDKIKKRSWYSKRSNNISRKCRVVWYSLFKSTR